MQHLQGLLVPTYESIMTRFVGMTPLGALVMGEKIMGLDANSLVGLGRW
jgi:hypothetical protein